MRLFLMTSMVFCLLTATGCPPAEDPCENVMCDEGETCVDGECVADDPCADVMCAEGETCVDGECVADDPCADVMCAEGETCVDGECVADDPCADVMCAEGETCVDGECVADDPCADVTCETCNECVDGVCQPIEGEVAAGEAFYGANGCSNCHGPNANDGFAPDLTGASCELNFDKLSGNVAHGGGTVDGITQQDAADLAAWLASL